MPDARQVRSDGLADPFDAVARRPAPLFGVEEEPFTALGVPLPLDELAELTGLVAGGGGQESVFEEGLRRLLKLRRRVRTDRLDDARQVLGRELSAL